MVDLALDFSSYISERTRDFTGREWIYQAIDSWLSNPDGSRCFLLTGEPGSGKSAIAARLAQISEGLISSMIPGCQYIRPGILSAIHFCSARERQWVNPHTFIQSLALQLAAHFPDYAAALVEKRGDERIRIDVRQQTGSITGQGKQIGVFIEHLDVSRVSAEDAFARVIAQPLEALYRTQRDTQVVILVDGLDETLVYTGEIGIVSLLAQTEAMPDNVRLLITSRQDARIETEFLDAESLFLSADQFNNQNDYDVQQYIERKASEVSILADQLVQLSPGEQEAIFNGITHKAAGNFRYITFLLNEMIGGKRGLTDLKGLPAGLDELYYQSLERLVKSGQKRWEEAYAPIVGILSVAQTRLNQEQLMQFARFDAEKSWSALLDLEQFVQRLEPENSEETFTYQLYHQSVSDFLGKQYITLENKYIPNRFYLTAETWHRHVADTYWDQYHADWSHFKDGYGLNNLAIHLYESSQFQRLYELINQEWMKVRFKNHNYEYDGFLSDLKLAWKNAHEEAIRQIKANESPEALALCIRYALIRTSINSLSANYAPGLIARAVETGLWPLERSLSIAAQVADADQRAKIYMALLRTEKLLVGQTNQTAAQGLAAALEIENGYSRAGALAALAPHLTAEQRIQALQQGLEAALKIEDDHACAEALAALAPYLSNEQKAQALQQALKAVSEIENEYWRAKALAALAPYLTGELLQQGFKTASEIENEYWRVEALAALAPHLSDEQKVHALQQGLQAASEIENDYARGKALAALAPHLTGELLQQGLQAALEIKDPSSRTVLLEALAPYLSGELLQQALQAALEIEADLARAKALDALVPHLSNEQKVQALQQALQAASEIEDASLHAEVLAALAPYLSNEQQAQALQQGLQAASEIKDHASLHAKALAALAPYLSSEQQAQALQQGLQAVLEIENEYLRADALADLAPHLSGELLQQALQAALEIEADLARANALDALPPNLTSGSRLLIVDHLYIKLQNRGREAILRFCAEKSIFRPPIIDRDTLAAIAGYIVEVCSHWEWQ